MSFYFVCPNGDKLPLSQRNDNGVKTFVLEKEKFALLCGEAYLSGDEWSATAGENGYFIIPMDTHLYGDVVVKFSKRKVTETDYFVEESYPIIPFFVVKKEGKLCVYKISHNYAWRVRGEYDGKEYRFKALYDLTREIADEDIVITELNVEGNEWYDGANAFRDYAVSAGEVVPNAKKMEREAFSYALDAPIIRIRMGWKPAPSPFETQTLENEPPMFVACTFERVRALITALHDEGVKRAEIQLVGWNIGGHDGRWPQAFPVDERLGGEDELKKTVQLANSFGFKVNCHYNSMDSYEIADIFSADLVAKDRAGNHVLGGSWGGGRSHIICPDRQIEACGKVIENFTRLGFTGLNYSDVLSILYPYVCFDEKHPSSTAKGIKGNEEVMRLHKKLFGGFSSEGAYYHALKELDFGLYVTFGYNNGGLKGCQDSNLIDETVPFTYMVLHGNVFYNVGSHTINYPIKSKGDRLELYANGGKPTFYFFSKFMANGKDWMGNVDFSLATDELLYAGAKNIKKAIDEYEKINDLQLAFIVKVSEVEKGVREVEYSNGAKMICNFTQNPAVVSSVTVPAEDFVVVRK